MDDKPPPGPRQPQDDPRSPESSPRAQGKAPAGAQSLSAWAAELITWYDLRAGIERTVPPSGVIRLGSIRAVQGPEGLRIRIYYLTQPSRQEMKARPERRAREH